MVSVELLTENVYCVRALMWNSYKEIKRALYGLNYGLRLNPSHICTFIFRGAIVKSIINENEEFDEHEEHEKVYEDIIDFVFIEYAQLISILWMLQTSTVLKWLISMTINLSSPLRRSISHTFLEKLSKSIFSWSSLDISHTITVVKLSERCT
ncbi:uncharacterized protein LOC144288551 isoform X3 [Canis aureus]